VLGRGAWALLELKAANDNGCTPIDHPGPRWSGYVHKLRKVGSRRIGYSRISRRNEPARARLWASGSEVNGVRPHQVSMRLKIRAGTRRIVAKYDDAGRLTHADNDWHSQSDRKRHARKVCRSEHTPSPRRREDLICQRPKNTFQARSYRLRSRSASSLVRSRHF
jgi:hypothetical protein